jgi:hypothetical protein
VETPGVEWKVKAATVASYVGGVVALFVLQLLSDGYLLDYMPTTVGTFVAPLIPAVVTFAAGWITKHTPRTSGLGVDIDALLADRVGYLADEVETRLRQRHGQPTSPDEFDAAAAGK